jgi:hypothetical protein
MALFRRHGDELESRLRARRREPGDEFVDGIVSRVSANGTRHRLQLALGVAVAAVGLAMFGAFGGLSYASSATESVAHVISPKPSTTPSPSGSVSDGTASTVQSSTASENQYVGKVTICHRPPNGGFTLLAVNANALPGHKGHGDTLPGAGGTCPGPPIP